MESLKVFACLLFTITFLSGLFLIYLRHKNEKPVFLIMCMDFFGKGLIFSISLFHFLPVGIQSLTLYLNISLLKTYSFLLLSSIICFFILKKYKAFKKVFCSKNNYYFPYMILVILSIHSFSEGFILTGNMPLISYLGISIAILLHKTSETLLLNYVTYAQGCSKNQQIIFLFLFSLVTPIGIWLGIEMDLKHLPSNLLWEGSFNVLAGFIFFYIIFNCQASYPFISEQSEQFKKRVVKTSFLAGAGLMAALAFWI